MGDPEYINNFTTMFPFAAVDFFISERRDNGSGDIMASEEVVVTRDRDEHYYAEPDECDVCAEFKERIRLLESENAALRGLHRRGYGDHGDHGH